jgi:type IV pilus assembly protein PilW
VHDLQMAGYGLVPIVDSAIECTTPAISAAATASGFSSLSPVTITDGGTAAGASDTITIRYSTSPAAGIPQKITGPGPDVSVDNNLGCQPGIAIVITGPNTCNIVTATALIGTTQVTLSPASGVPGDNLACLGVWNQTTYRANAGNLEQNGTPIVAGIVNIQAQYGISATANSNQIIQWVDPTDATWAAPTTTNRNLIKAIRVAVVARNDSLEKTIVSRACVSATSDAAPICSWSDVPANPAIPGSLASPAPTINLSNDANWQNYRYRVFETIIPLRNVIWSKDTF